MKIQLAYTLLFSTLFSGYALAQIPNEFSPTPSFEDNFDGTTLNTQKWDYRGLGVRKNCINTQSAVIVRNGHLTIKTYSDSSSGKLQNYCGMISTQKSFLQSYGYWEAAIRFNRAEGNQVAFWVQSPTMGLDLTNPEKSGVEIDVFEHLAEATQDQYDHAIHWNGYGSAHKEWSKRLSTSKLADGKFHKFAVAWTPKGYTFYVDDIPQNLSGLDQVPISIANQYIILSSEVPRSYPAQGYGPINTTTATFDVDYVKVYPYIGNKK
ncbi:glycoside hydrolase family 16 protein [Photorhabdus caribbeanensis]|uniref:glycoside hydrolase family 16 protein n=1 Tax=Photorhabdus caribbeanensis TaxID=1004165 RepID=UPI001BD25C34|nr:glycoside hydrolase family 16 protein [Photorhabdus caribbeanensis]MBS9422456.1 glycosyl hydrolase family protein [Photorhabdus caribbeanensis]